MQAVRNTRAHLSKVGMSTVLIQREVKKTGAHLTKFPASDKKKGKHTHTHTELHTAQALLLQVTGVTQQHGRNPVIPPDRLNDRLVS